MKRKSRVLMAKPGIDGHWRGAKIVSTALRDAGFEVIFAGNMSPEAIAKTAVQEDVDFVGLSILAAGHMRIIRRVLDALREEKASDMIVTVGGTIPQPDIPELKEMGVSEVFPPGSKIDKIVDFFKNSVTGDSQAA
ncbi:MAG: cobalamin B12-binding domain-containing protein [Desulfatiglans sp.]|nr:cobalamin B12-binding domain-containing protein [Thermodesulfobacteriota bacterium]MEE4351307.1 cobalamin B12-binding domain-containing protein [Desulfatiglans sp.]